MGDLFKYAIIRETAYNFSKMANFDFEEMNLSLTKYYNINVKLLFERECISSSLYDHIALPNVCSSHRRNLINLRRDLYNFRFSSNYSHDKLDSNIIESISNFRKTHQQLILIKEDISSKFELFFQESNNSLIKYSLNFHIKNGILFSSADLYDALNKYQSSNLNLSYSRKLSSSLYRSILNYVTRSSVKTSPFSTFNVIGICNLSNSKISNDYSITCSYSKFRINNLLYYNLKNYFRSKIELTLNFKLYTNCTTAFDGFDLAYFYHFNNDESFNYLKCSNNFYNDIINFINSQTPSVHGFLEYLTNNVYIDGAAEDIFNRLVNLGIVQIKFPIDFRSDNWLEEYILLLRNLECFDLANLLNSVSRVSNCLPLLRTPEEKYKVLNELTLKFSNSKFQNIFSKINYSNLFYEDYIDDKSNTFALNDINPHSDTFKYFSKFLKSISFKSVGKIIINDLFDKYSLNDKIPLLDFYKNYYLNYDILKLTQGLFYKKLKVIIFDYLSIRSVDCEFDFLTFIKSKYTLADKFDTPFDLFVQFDSDTVVLNEILLGHGFNLDRFYNLFPSININLSRNKYLSRIKQDFLIAELRDSSIHNTQYKSTSISKVIDVSQQSSSKESIPLSDLYLSREKDGKVKLINSAGVSILPIDVSLESIGRRSALFQFINIFSDDNSMGLKSLNPLYIEFYKNKLPNELPFIYIPRIYLSKNIVMNRAIWVIDFKFLAKMLKKSGNVISFFSYFYCWRIENNIPNISFIKYFNMDNGSYSKPIYMNFSSPVHFQNFVSIIQRNKIKELELHESLPDYSANNNMDKKSKEYVFSFF